MEARSSYRQREILDALRQAGGAMRITALAEALDVTNETVRRNLHALVDGGMVEKTHGGAQLVRAEADPEVEGNFRQRFEENTAAKRMIARHVAAMIPNDASLFLDIGSTTAHIADALRNHQRLLVVTNSVYVAYRLAMRNENRVFMAGGALRSHDGGAFGSDAMDFASNFNTEYAILSSAGITAPEGFTLFDLEEARFSRLVMAHAAQRIVAADSSKFGREAPIVIGDPAQVDFLVCEAEPPEDIRHAARAWGTEIRIARGAA
ncbi:MAG: DeoR/GlpR transcriptional regulator [Rhodobacteraceae bacterium]|nr:DeoR/GlpR transcriptional regulator [Paracoccaceae bacterium]